MHKLILADNFLEVIMEMFIWTAQMYDKLFI